MSIAPPTDRDFPGEAFPEEPWWTERNQRALHLRISRELWPVVAPELVLAMSSHVSEKLWPDDYLYPDEVS